MVGVWATGDLLVGWTAVDAAAGSGMTCSVKLSSARSECKMEVAYLLHRGHLGVL